VLCSPPSAVSPWVLDEVANFKALGKEHRIIPVLIEGEPGAADAPLLLIRCAMRVNACPRHCGAPFVQRARPLQTACILWMKQRP